MKRSEKREIREKLRKFFAERVMNSDLPDEVDGWSEEAITYAEAYKSDLARGLLGQLSGLPESS